MAPFKYRLYYKASAIVACGGFIFGFDTGTIGPVTTMASFRSSFGPLTPLQHGLVVSSILLSGAVSGLFAGNIADKYGRATSFIIGGTLFGIGAALEASAQSLGMFTGGRVIAGFGEGIFLGNLTVYICEIVPARRRGPWASLVQLLVTMGLSSGYFLCYGTSRLQGSLSWRIPLIFHSACGLSFAIGCCFLPPSPRWLISQGRIVEARDTLMKLGLASSEMEQMAEEVVAAPIADAQRSLYQGIKHHFSDLIKVFRKGSRSPAALACTLMAFQQLSGMDGVLYYAPTLFARAGLSSEEASFLASGVSALIMMFVTIFAFLLSDHWGRRASAITGGITLSSTMLLIGSLYAANAVHGDHGVGRWIVIVMIYLFSIFFSITWAITFRVYASEIQPLSTRASASSLAQSSNWFVNWVVAFTTPILLAKSSFGAYFLFGFSSFLCLIVCIFAMPETKGRSLESIEQSFANKTTGISLASMARRRNRGNNVEGVPDEAGHLSSRPTLLSQ